MEQPKQIVALDFETYYDSQYSLRAKTISTTEYIRDPRFKVQGVSIRTGAQRKAAWYKDTDVRSVLSDIDWTETGMLAHHAHFDGLIASHHYGVIPAFYYCTLSMARPLHGGEVDNDLDSVSRFYGGKGKISDVLERTKGIRELPPELMAELGEYANRDVDEMCRIYGCMLPYYTDKELQLIHYTIQAYANPVLTIKKKLALEVHAEEVAEKLRLIKQVCGIDPDAQLSDKEFNALKKKLNSREPFAQRLRDLGVEPPKKISPATNKPTYAFAKNDLAFQALQNHPNEQVRDLVEAKLVCGSSIEQTRALRLISHCKAPHRLPIYLAYGKAHTFRWTGGDKMNPQNFGRNSKLRNVITAPPGHKLVIVDSGQIEARVNAWLAGETELVEAFRNGEDIYSVFAGEEIYFIAVNQVTKEQRFVGKVCVLGLGYQMGGSKLQYTLEAGTMGPKVVLPDVGMYHSAVQRYRARFSRIRDQWYTMNDMLFNMYKGSEHQYGPIKFIKNGVELPNGMTLKYPHLEGEWNEHAGRYENWKYNRTTHIYGGLLTENIVQALARIIVAEQSLRVADKYRIVLLVHDEVVLCVPNNQANRALDDTLTSFHEPLDWCKDLPVTGEGVTSKCYLKM